MIDYPTRSLSKDPPHRLEKFLFLVVLLLNTAIFVFLIADSRMVRGHDTWYYYSSQYVFMANASANGELALWMPYMTHGTLSSGIFNSQAGFLQNILIPLAPLFRGANFLTLFYLGILLDELLLLVGVWFLARRYYSSPYTVFFTAIAVTGSCMWADQMFFNFHLYYAAPLIIYLIHEFLEHGTHWKLFLAVNLLVFHTIGNAAYLAIFTALVILVYFAGHFILFRRSTLRKLSALRFEKLDIVWGLLILLTLACVYGSFVGDTSDLTTYEPGRQADLSVTVDTFLTYGGSLNPVRYLDFLFGLSPTLDYTIFCGFFTLAFAVLALFYNPGKNVLHLLFMVVLILFFSMGSLSIVPVIAYYLVPTMPYYRHVAAVAPYLKLFVIFLSGYGFEAIMVRRSHRKLPIAFTSVTLLILSLILSYLSLDVMLGNESFARLLPSLLQTARPMLTPFKDLLNPVILSDLLGSSALGAGLAGGILLLFTRRRLAPFVLGLVLILHPIELFSWKFRMFNMKTFRLDSTQYALQKLQPIPYVPRRSLDYHLNDRFQAFGFIFFGREQRYGALGSTTDSYLFADTPMSPFRTAYWMHPLDDLMRAYLGLDLRDRSVFPPGLPTFQATQFPMSHPAVGKIIGLTEDKVQIFSRARLVNSEQEMAKLISDKAFAGDMLFVLTQQGNQESSASQLERGEIFLKTNDRLDADYEVLQFDANGIELKITLPDDREGAWILYCDVWHPDWTATVNDNAVVVSKAHLAYKAVPLQPGENLVKFRFSSPSKKAFFGLVILNSLLWIGVVVWFIAGIFLGKRRKPAEIEFPSRDSE